MAICHFSVGASWELSLPRIALSATLKYDGLEASVFPASCRLSCIVPSFIWVSGELVDFPIGASCDEKYSVMSLCCFGELELLASPEDSCLLSVFCVALPGSSVSSQHVVLSPIS